MIQRPDGCQGCPLNTKSVAGFCPDKVSPNPKYLFLGEAPGKNEIVKGEPFIGTAGFVLWNWLVRAVPQLQVALEKNEVTVANTLRCLPPEIQGRPYPRGQEKLDAEAYCRQYDQPMDGVETIVLFGETPQRLLFKEDLEAEDAVSRSLGRELKGVTGRIGRVIERDGRRYVFAPHPAYILRQPALVGQGQEALRIAINADKVLEPQILHWDDAIGELT